MSSTHEIDPHRKLVTLRFTGEIDLPAVIEARRRILDDDRFRPGFRLLVDLTDAKVRRLSSSGVRDRARDAPPVSRIAILAEPGAVTFGIARMYQAVSPLPVAVFTDREDAMRWLQEEKEDDGPRPRGVAEPGNSAA